jgi:hypothetical protein
MKYLNAATKIKMRAKIKACKMLGMPKKTPQGFSQPEYLEWFRQINTVEHDSNPERSQRRLLIHEYLSDDSDIPGLKKKTTIH